MILHEMSTCTARSQRPYEALVEAQYTALGGIAAVDKISIGVLRDCISARK